MIYFVQEQNQVATKVKVQMG